MPGLTNNTVLLEALNQTIVALNELVTEVSNLDLSVVNNLPPLQVTNNLPPMEITNDVDVNFDTASIVTELDLIKQHLLDLASDTDELTGLAEIANLVVQSTTANTRLEEIRDRLADPNDSIGKAIRESQSTVTKVIDLAVSYGAPDPVKCTNAKALIGFISEDLRLKKEKMDFYVSAGVNTANLAQEILSGTGFGTLEPFGLIEAVAGGIVSLGSIWADVGVSDFATMQGDFEANKEAFLCDVYSCDTPQTTLAAFRARVTTTFTPIDTIFAGMEEVFVAASDMLARVFTDDITADEIARYTNWTGSDCTNCLGNPCPADLWIEGTPALYNGAVWTLDTLTRVNAPSGVGITPDIAWEMNTARSWTLHQITDGAVCDVFCRDCDRNLTPDGFRQNLTNAVLPITFSACNEVDILGLKNTSPTDWADITIIS